MYYGEVNSITRINLNKEVNSLIDHYFKLYPVTYKLSMRIMYT
jgi:hypothetical protein